MTGSRSFLAGLSVPGTGPSRAAALHIQRLPGGLDITEPQTAAGCCLRPAQARCQSRSPAPARTTWPCSTCWPAPHSSAACARAGWCTSARPWPRSTPITGSARPRRWPAAAQLWGADQAHDGQLITGPAAADRPVATARPHRTLIIGGARSGKSTEAELRLAGEPQVTYVAAGPFPPVSRDEAPHGWPEGGRPADGQSWTGLDGDQSWTGPDGDPDTEWARRVAVHRARRPAWWRTVESLDHRRDPARQRPARCSSTASAPGWPRSSTRRACGPPRNRLAQLSAITGGTNPDPAAVVQARIDELVAAWRQTSALVVAVTDQVGSGLVPAYPAGRVFRDQLGWLNQRLAAESELNLQVVAGRVTTLPG